MHPTSPAILSVLPDAKTHTEKNQEDHHISTAKADKRVNEDSMVSEFWVTCKKGA